MAFLYALPGAVAEGLIWGLMAIGVYISYKILDIADLTVDGSICTGACVCAVLLGMGLGLMNIVPYFGSFSYNHTCAVVNNQAAAYGSTRVNFNSR